MTRSALIALLILSGAAQPLFAQSPSESSSEVFA